MTVWHIITGEYPPTLGGVADYSRLVADGLAQCGDEVHVWAPGPHNDEHGAVAVHALPDHLGPKSLSVLRARIGRASGQRILVQYVPHALGTRAVNLGFCWWLASLPKVSIDLMFHEVALTPQLGWPLRRNALAAVQRLMACLATRSASRIFVSIPAWRKTVAPWARDNALVRWLPVPSTVPVVEDDCAISSTRRRLASNDAVAGHFGTYGSLSEMLAHTIVDLCHRRGAVTVLLLGRGSCEFANDLIRREPWLNGRLHAAGELTARDLSLHLSICDVMLQPYPDGISTRRTSSMASLAHGRPIVTTSGHLTEPLWHKSSAIAIAPIAEPARLVELTAELLENSAVRSRMSVDARSLYDNCFDLRHTINALRDTQDASIAQSQIESRNLAATQS